MKPSVIVWDLETVPDLAGFAAAPRVTVIRAIKNFLRSKLQVVG
jgi:hypothetical protein